MFLMCVYVCVFHPPLVALRNHSWLARETTWMLGIKTWLATCKPKALFVVLWLLPQFANLACGQPLASQDPLILAGCIPRAVDHPEKCPQDMNSPDHLQEGPQSSH